MTKKTGHPGQREGMGNQTDIHRHSCRGCQAACADGRTKRRLMLSQPSTLVQFSALRDIAALVAAVMLFS